MMPPGRSPSRLHSFRYAFRGWWLVLRTQRNAWIHAVASLAVVGASAWLRISTGEWALILLSIGVVWLAEFVNSALEAVVDLASPGAHPLARAGKDIGAAAVLIAAATAAAVGTLVLGPRLIERVTIGSAPGADLAAPGVGAVALQTAINCDIIPIGPRRGTADGAGPRS
jgi:diacylglycerol kinase